MKNMERIIGKIKSIIGSCLVLSKFQYSLICGLDWTCGPILQRTLRGPVYGLCNLFSLLNRTYRSIVRISALIKTYLVYVWVLVSEGDTTNVAFSCMVLLADEFPQSLGIYFVIDRVWMGHL